MPVRVYLSEESMTAYLMGEIDHHSAKAIREEIDETAQRAHPEELVLDFKDVTFMDSSGIGLVMGRYALMQELGGELRVTNQSTHIRKVMKLAGLDRLAVMEPKKQGRAAAVRESQPAVGEGRIDEGSSDDENAERNEADL